MQADEDSLFKPTAEKSYGTTGTKPVYMKVSDFAQLEEGGDAHDPQAWNREGARRRCPRGAGDDASDAAVKRAEIAALNSICETLKRPAAAAAAAGGGAAAEPTPTERIKIAAGLREYAAMLPEGEERTQIEVRAAKLMESIMGMDL